MLLAVIGPGFITANVDNDAGGIYTYSAAGAQFGYQLLWVMIPMTMPVEEVIQRINNNDAELIRHQAMILIDEQKRLKGIITRGDLLKAMREGHSTLTVAEVGTTINLVTASPDMTVREALIEILKHDIGRLPVIDENTRVVIGYLSRGNIMAANLRKLNEETEAQEGWVGRRHLRPFRSLGKGWGIRRPRTQ